MNKQKVWILSLGFMDGEIVDLSMRRFYQTQTLPGGSFEHVLLDHHWPIDYWTTRVQLTALAMEYNMTLMSPHHNMGAHGGYNWLMKNLPLEDDDLIIFYDGDTLPVTKGWDEALVNTIKLLPTYAALFLQPDCDEFKIYRYDEAIVDGVRVSRPTTGVAMISAGIWRWSFLKAVGGFHAHYQHYGQIEIPMMELIKQKGLSFGYLPDFKEERRIIQPNPLYTQWKMDHLAFRTSLNFKEYLEAKAILPSVSGLPLRVEDAPECIH